MTERNEPIQRSRRRALWLTIPVLLGLAACGGADEPVSAPDGYTPTACEDGQRETTPEATYECLDGAWVHATPTTTPEVRKSLRTPPTVPPTVPTTSTLPPPPPVVYTVTNVTDGDTVDVSSSDGQVFTVEVLGIDAPEVGTGCAADLATETTASLVLGREVALPMGAHGEDTDRDGRRPRFVEVDGTDVGLALISFGLASARHDSLDGYANHGREAEYHQRRRCIDRLLVRTAAACLLHHRHHRRASTTTIATRYERRARLRSIPVTPVGGRRSIVTTTASDARTRRRLRRPAPPAAACASCAAGHLHGVRCRGR